MNAMAHRSDSKFGAVCAVVGAVLLLVGTYLHPMQADPNDAVAAFTEYAADRLWVASHLTQLAGVTLMVAALLILARRLEATSGSTWPRLAAGGAIASLALAAALQAVDGIAMKAMVDAWAIAPATQTEAGFYAAFAVRQIEIGLASAASMLFGLTVTAYGAALWCNRTYPKWVAVLAILAGPQMTIAGVVTAYAGFSELTMTISMPASLLVLVWMLALGVLMWRRGEEPSVETAE
jgi:uncharacterized membrane protein YhaH (DUF805 family)